MNHLSNSLTLLNNFFIALILRHKAIQSNLQLPTPKMRRICGRLREVVAYESRTVEGLLQEVQSHLLFFWRECIEWQFLGYNNM